MQHNDHTVGQVFSRRQALSLVGTPALLWLFQCSTNDNNNLASDDKPLTGSCIVRPELTEGPYYVDTNLNRSDIRADTNSSSAKEGASLTLTFNVSRIENDACTPLENALVDIWHCDALGNYSGVGNLQGQNFLRGYQLTDAEGRAAFTTIYPGWYPGRAVHIHFKVRASASSSTAYEFTSQLFFDDNLSAKIYKREPYTTKGKQDRLNTQDGIYAQSKGDTLLAVSETEDSYSGEFNIALYV